VWKDVRVDNYIQFENLTGIEDIESPFEDG
jgi:hypothetical protein